MNYSVVTNTLWHVAGQFSQNLDFVAGTRILTEIKIENHGKIYFAWKKIDKHTFFPMKIKMMDLNSNLQRAATLPLPPCVSVSYTHTIAPIFMIDCI